MSSTRTPMGQSIAGGCTPISMLYHSRLLSKMGSSQVLLNYFARSAKCVAERRFFRCLPLLDLNAVFCIELL